MTSPSLKNHPTTAQPSPTRSSGRSLWKQLLAGALCLCVTGALSAEEEKPLDRLKQRSARQRWRELKGEWIPAPEAPGIRGRRETPPPLVPEFLPMQLSAPRETAVPVQTPETPPIQKADSGEWQAVPVPEPGDVAPEVVRDAFVRPGAKPPADIEEPLFHEGSVVDSEPAAADVPVDSVARPMPRDPDLPHFPFRDETPLVESLRPGDTFSPRAPAPAEPQAVRVAELPGEGTSDQRLPVSEPESVMEPLTSPLLEEDLSADSVLRPVPPADEELVVPPQSSPIRIVQQPADPPSSNAEPAYNPPVETTSTASRKRPVKSIREIDPFSDYATSEEAIHSTPASRQAPDEIELASQGQIERNNASTAVYWEASHVTHNPLYFEDVGLERSGHTFSECVQPFVSLGRFGAQVVALPYAIALDPVWKDESTLGHHRPGECQTPRHLAVPLNAEAAATAAAAYSGIIFLLP